MRRLTLISIRIQVSAIDADVIFSSSDGVLFNIHRKNLEIVSGAFPPAEFSTDKEIVPLTESSAILELLFQFVYPRQLPDIHKVQPFTSLMELAEAAEKYEVYPAINACKIRMRLVTITFHSYAVINLAKVYIIPLQSSQSPCHRPCLRM
jgi:hypothetical protein